MSQSQIVQARINKEIKEEASTVLANFGLSISDIIRIVLPVSPMKRLFRQHCSLPTPKRCKPYTTLKQKHLYRLLIGKYVQGIE